MGVGGRLNEDFGAKLGRRFAPFSGELWEVIFLITFTTIILIVAKGDFSDGRTLR